MLKDVSIMCMQYFATRQSRGAEMRAEEAVRTRLPLKSSASRQLHRQRFVGLSRKMKRQGCGDSLDFDPAPPLTRCGHDHLAYHADDVCALARRAPAMPLLRDPHGTGGHPTRTA